MFEDIYNNVLIGEVDGVKSRIQKALDEGAKPAEIINRGLIRAMDEVGARMRAGEMFVPEVLIAAEAMKEGLAVVKPLLEGESYAIGKVVIGTVAGDLHDIGKNLVAMLLESSGFTVVDLGVDVSPESFVEAAAEHQPQIVGLSALLTTTMVAMEETVKALREKSPQIKTMVGGAPVSEEFARQIGAGGYAPDGASAVELAKRLLEG
ncbi:MAG TPA: corrinoid protein [Bacillota bacterium]|jgi:5-methyltetrahydrofolate--homocysteine methyltransferase|nr:corrinoid protein [Bacillota bacterium]HOL15696.1 corrinoid protein [Bacillota bacterium]